jgi:hypothetical protein
MFPEGRQSGGHIVALMKFTLVKVLPVISDKFPWQFLGGLETDTQSDCLVFKSFQIDEYQCPQRRNVNAKFHIIFFPNFSMIAGSPIRSRH